MAQDTMHIAKQNYEMLRNYGTGSVGVIWWYLMKKSIVLSVLHIKPVHMKSLSRVEVEVAKRSELHTFAVIPKRWVVERTFGWLDKCRRLWKNCERKLQDRPYNFRYFM